VSTLWTFDFSAPETSLSTLTVFRFHDSGLVKSACFFSVGAGVWGDRRAQISKEPAPASRDLVIRDFRHTGRFFLCPVICWAFGLVGTVDEIDGHMGFGSISSLFDWVCPLD
jgi:hypothetical protein